MEPTAGRKVRLNVDSFYWLQTEEVEGFLLERCWGRVEDEWLFVT